jgi:hypothetical protein
MDHHIEIKRECPRCQGTGVFQGMAERDGFAVICHACDGNGWNMFSLDYNDPPEERKKRYDIHTVVEHNPGICLGGDLHFGGMPYIDWLIGDPFPPKSEDRKHTCPRWWYQGTDQKRIWGPTWEKCNQTLGTTFSKCKFFRSKAMCWEQWDKEDEQWHNNEK